MYRRCTQLFGALSAYANSMNSLAVAIYIHFMHSRFGRFGGGCVLVVLCVVLFSRMAHGNVSTILPPSATPTRKIIPATAQPHKIDCFCRKYILYNTAECISECTGCHRVHSKFARFMQLNLMGIYSYMRIKCGYTNDRFGFLLLSIYKTLSCE